MIASLLLLLPVPAPTIAVAGPAAIVQDDAAHDEAIAAAGDDVAKLVALAESWTEAGDRAGAKKVWNRVVELDENHEAARKALGHRFYDDQWFTSFAAFSKYRREHRARMLEEHGLVPYEDEWVLEADLPYLRMGWEKSEDGKWLQPGVKERLEREARYKADGWVQQTDLVWVSPDEVGNWEKGLWKVGDEWMNAADANEYHSKLGQWWTWPSDHFVALTTCTNEEAAWIVWWAEQTYPDLVRFFGVQPEGRTDFMCLDSVAQYNAFAGGDPEAQRPPSESTGWSSMHYAFFAELFVDRASTPPRYRGMGVCYWDNDDENLRAYGTHAVRHAAAQSFIDRIDPSWGAISAAMSGDGAGADGGAFWSEKKFPMWMRYGAASYVERFFEDRTKDPATENPLWAREWAFQNIRAVGDIRPVQEILDWTPDGADAAAGAKIAETGLVVAFILDGGCAPVRNAHAAFKAALKSGEGVAEAIEGLEAAIVENEEKLRAFAGF